MRHRYKRIGDEEDYTRPSNTWYTNRNKCIISVCIFVFIFWLVGAVTMGNFLTKKTDVKTELPNIRIEESKRIIDEIEKELANQAKSDSSDRQSKEKEKEKESKRSSKVISDLFDDEDKFDTEHWCHSLNYQHLHFKHIKAGKRASCLFENLCVVQLPETVNSSHEIEWIYISDHAPTETSFTLGVGPHSVDEKLYFEPIHFTKEQFESVYPTIIRENGTSVVFHEYNAENFGHMVPDVLLPIYSALEALDIVSDDVKLFRYSIADPIGIEYGWSCDYLIKVLNRTDVKEICERMYKNVLPLLTKNAMQILNASVDVPICFDRLVVGMSQYSDDCMEAGHGRKTKIHPRLGEFNCLTGRQKQFWDFRVNGLRNFGLDTDVLPNKHQIVVTNRSNGYRLNNRSLNNLDDLVVELKQKYGDENVLVVNWPELSMSEQLRIISQTTVHVTPPGGISYIALFLPRWATTIRLYSTDYLLDWHIFNYLAYIRPEHVNCSGGNIEVENVMRLVEESMDLYEVMSESDNQAKGKAD